MGQGGTLGSGGAPDLQHHDRRRAIGRELARGCQCRGTFDLFGEAADHPRLFILYEVADVVSQVDVGLVAAGDGERHADVARKQRGEDAWRHHAALQNQADLARDDLREGARQGVQAAWHV